jgi:hypothetical protein
MNDLSNDARQSLLLRRREVSRRIQQLLRRPDDPQSRTMSDVFALRDLLAEQEELKRDLRGAPRRSFRDAAAS